MFTEALILLVLLDSFEVVWGPPSVGSVVGHEVNLISGDSSYSCSSRLFLNPGPLNGPGRGFDNLVLDPDAVPFPQPVDGRVGWVPGSGDRRDGYGEDLLVISRCSPAILLTDVPRCQSFDDFSGAEVQGFKFVDEISFLFFVHKY